MKTTGLQYGWKTAIKNYEYRTRLIAGMILLIIILSIFPFFFQHVQEREGPVLNDVLLNNLPAINVSVPLFVAIWCSALLIIIRVIKSPEIFLNFLWTFIVLSLCRILTISIVEIDPPARLIPLVDPLANAFYGKSFITKDLFFSGHTATVFIIYLCLQKKLDRALTLAAAVIVGILVLFQHVHYTIDVLCAPPFAFLCYYLGIKIAGQKQYQKASPS